MAARRNERVSGVPTGGIPEPRFRAHGASPLLPRIPGVARREPCTAAARVGQTALQYLRHPGPVHRRGGCRELSRPQILQLPPRTTTNRQGVRRQRSVETWRLTVPLLTVLTPCFNEEENVREIYDRVKAAMATVS